MDLSADEVKRLVAGAIKRLVVAIDQSRESGEPAFDASPGLNELLLAKDAFGTYLFPQFPDSMYAMQTGALVQAVQNGAGEPGAQLASHLMQARGITSPGIDSELFHQLSLQVLRVQIAMRQVAYARSVGDQVTEERIAEHYRRQLSGTQLAATVDDAPATSVKLSEAWHEYSEEKLSASPRPVWRPKTALGQAATFAEFLELTGDIEVGTVTREMMLTYRKALARLPSNRQKRYPGKSARELVEMDIPDSERPSSKTISEKIVRIGSFLKWCRTTKEYLRSDPLAGVQISSDSKSYVAFNQTDLEAMFHSDYYRQAMLRKSWQFWCPLIALYAGARQAEIAQLMVSDISQEDGVWIIAITDEGEEQQVKTTAGIRKVPVSSKLVQLGFLDYVRAVKAEGHSRLFPDLQRGKHGWGHKVSRWFNDTFRKNCGIKPDATGGRKVFHSFRHLAITTALGKGQPISHVQQVFGHEKSLLGESATYMGAFPVATLVPIVEALDFGLDHTAYDKAWIRFAKEAA